MIKQPLGLCGWEMQIYRLPDLHLNANAASRLELDPAALKTSPAFLCLLHAPPEVLSHLEPK